MALSSVKCIGVSFIEESEIIISEATKNTSAVFRIVSKMESNNTDGECLWIRMIKHQRNHECWEK